jgi:hypothetical protein
VICRYTVGKVIRFIEIDAKHELEPLAVAQKHFHPGADISASELRFHKVMADREKGKKRG